MSKKTPVFTPIDSGIKKKDAPTPIKRKRNNNETEITETKLTDLNNILQTIFEENKKEEEEKKNKVSSFKPIDFHENEDNKKKTKLIKPIAINKIDSDENYDSVLEAFEDEVVHIDSYSNKEFEVFLNEITQFINMYDTQYRDNLLNLKESEYVKIKNTLISLLEDLLEKNETNIKIKNNEEEINDLLDKVLNDLFTEKSDIVKKTRVKKKKKFKIKENSAFSSIKKGGMSNNKKTLKKNRKMLKNHIIGGGLSKNDVKKKGFKTKKKRKLKISSNTKKNKYLKEIIRTEDTEEPWKLYQKKIYPDKINNWRNLIEKATPTSPKETYFDCAYNVLYFLDDINYDVAKDGCKKTNFNKSGIDLHEFMEEFIKIKDKHLKKKLKMKNVKKINNYKYEFKKICIQDVITTLNPGHGTYLLYKHSNAGHAVIIARGVNNKFYIIDPQKKIYEMDLFKYIYENKMATSYVIIKKPIVIEKKYA